LTVDQASDGEGSLGLLWFPFIGPAVIPEPSSIALLFLGGLIVGPARKFLTRSGRGA